MKDEALIVVGAGTLTTSWALCVAIFYLLKSPKILTKLRFELETAIEDPETRLPLPQLEKLPYLTAVIQEALRLSYGVSSRLQRISPDRALVYTDPSCGKSWTIPPGTPVGMTSVLIHHDEAIFSTSHAFRPERWIENPELNKYLVAFSKGSRQCLGINLAYAEMYLVLSAVFRRHGSTEANTNGTKGLNALRDEGLLELIDPHEREVKIEADGFIPLRSTDAKGIKVRIL